MSSSQTEAGVLKLLFGSDNSDSDDELYAPPFAVDSQQQPRQQKRQKRVDAEKGHDDNELFMKRWIEQGDREAMLTLLRDSNKNGELAMYVWDMCKMHLQKPASAGDLIGDYDIVFVHGIPDGTDQGWTDDRSLCRTLRSGTLTFERQTIPEGNYFYSEGIQVVDGTITGVNGSYICNQAPTGGWEWTLQMNDVEIREFPDGYFGDNDGPAFCILQNGGCDATDEYEARVQVLTNSGILHWTPTEEQASSSSWSSPLRHNREDNKSYIKFMQEQIRQRHRDRNFGWREEHSWLCHHMGLPATTACRIHSYNRHPLPEPQWSWRKGDLLVELNMTEYATCWKTFYIARPRQEDVKNKLLNGLNLDDDDDDRHHQQDSSDEERQSDESDDEEDRPKESKAEALARLRAERRARLQS